MSGKVSLKKMRYDFTVNVQESVYLKAIPFEISEYREFPTTYFWGMAFSCLLCRLNTDIIISCRIFVRSFDAGNYDLLLNPSYNIYQNDIFLNV